MKVGVRRRIAALSEFPPAVLSMIEGLVWQRLLVRDRRKVSGTLIDTIEVVHEAILRQWPPLARWIEEEHDALRARDLLVSAAMEWRNNGKAKSWLAHRGERFAEAERLGTVRNFVRGRAVQHVIRPSPA
jgi:hypothetical protein